MRRLTIIAALACMTLQVGYLQAQLDRKSLDNAITLKVGETYEKEIDVKGQRSPKGKVYLKFAARIDARWKDGSQPGMDIFVNNIPMDKHRLVSKPPFYPFGEHDVQWHKGGARWTVPYYVWNVSTPPQEHIHLFVFDITSLLDSEKAKIRIVDIFSAFPGSTLELRDIEVLYKDDFPVAKGEYPQFAGPLDALRDKASGFQSGSKIKLSLDDEYQQQLTSPVAPKRDFAQAYEATVAKDGTINLVIAGETYSVTSSFGLPSLGWVAAAPGKAWSTFEGGNDGIVLENGQIRIERTLHRTPTHVEIRDRLINRTGSDLPVGVLNAVDVVDLSSLSAFRIAGKASSSFWANTEPMTGSVVPMLPLAFVARQKSALGLWLHDDAYRNHASFLVNDSKLYAADERFYLKPKGEYTFIWRLYPANGKSYYTVLNSLRHDEKFYQEIPGLLGFVYPEQRVDSNLTTPENVKSFFDRFGITVAGMLPVEEIVTKPRVKQYMVYANETLDRIEKSNKSPERVMKLAKEGEVKGVSYIVYTDVHLINARHEKDWVETLGESVVRDEQGRLVPFSAGWLYGVLPMEGTPGAKRVEASIDWYMKEGGYDGIFFDEWPHSRCETTFVSGHEDGVSALIDDSFTLRRKYGHVPLLVKDFQRRLVRKIKANNPNAVLYANHFDKTSEAAHWPIVHFAEPTQHDDDFLRAAQGGRTPLALNTKYTDSLWSDAKAFLRQGVLMAFYSKRFEGNHLLRHIYPITVKENGPGYVIGEDKIVTHCSGTYHFNRQNPLVAQVFGGKKAEFLREVDHSVMEGGIAKLELKISDDEIAIIREKVEK